MIYEEMILNYHSLIQDWLIFISVGKHEHHEHWTLFDSFVLTYRSLTMRGSHNILDTDRKKFIAISMMIGGMQQNFQETHLSSLETFLKQI